MQLPDVVLFLEQINTSPSAWHATINLESTFFSIPFSKEHQKQFALSC